MVQKVNTDLAEILANVIKDDIPPTLNVSEQNLCSHGETSNATNTCEIDKEINRKKGKVVSDNVFNLSRRNITDDEFKSFKQRSKFCFNARENRSLASEK